MRQFQYRGQEPITIDDAGNMSYRNHEVNSFDYYWYRKTHSYPAPREIVREHYQDEMSRIDKEIEEANKPAKPYRYEDTADYGMEVFWAWAEQ